MAERCLLHLSKVREFGAWIESKGFVLAETRSEYEILRAKKPGRTVIVYKRADAKQHASVMERDYRLVRTFIDETKGGDAS